MRPEIRAGIADLEAWTVCVGGSVI